MIKIVSGASGNNNLSVLFCDEGEFAFGPVIKDENKYSDTADGERSSQELATGFLQWVGENFPYDLRTYPDNNIRGLFTQFRLDTYAQNKMRAQAARVLTPELAYA